MLTHCLLLPNYHLKNKYHVSKCINTEIYIICLFRNHVKKSLEEIGSVIEPLKLYDKLKDVANQYKWGRLSDAYEYLCYLIDELKKEN